ncbi:MAG: insulinase family protein, partial [Planctomycetota bacterium]
MRYIGRSVPDNPRRTETNPKIARPVIATLAALLVVAAIHRPSESAFADDRPMPRIARLDSGLRVVIVEDRALPLVSVQLWARVGSAQDPPRRAGLAHLLRVALSRHRDLDLKMRALGLRVFDATYHDACLFEIVAPAALLDRVLAAQRERLGLEQIDERSLDALKSAVRAAAAECGATLADSVEREALARLYPQHPYGRIPSDVEPSLSELSADEATLHLQRWFAAGNLTLVVVGDVRADVVEGRARAQFADLAWA